MGEVISETDATAGNDWQATYVEAEAPVAIADTDNTVRDANNTTMQSATIVLTNAQADDLLTIGTLPAGMGSTIDTSVAGEITISLSGNYTNAQYAEAIRNITFSNTGSNLSEVDRIINVQTNDGTFDSNVAVTTISVKAVIDR